MSDEPSTIYLVTGSNRGIGLGLVNQILRKHKNAFVYAGVRNPTNESALDVIKKEYPDRMAIVKLVSGDVEGNKAVAKEIEEKHGRVDTMIANAAICNLGDYVRDVNSAELDEHFHINVTGTVVLFQAMYSLLKKSSDPHLIIISSSAGQLNGAAVRRDFGNVTYGSSKAALNWVARKIHFENEWLTTFPMCPGPVDTDMLRENLAKDTKGAMNSVRNTAYPTAEVAAVSLIDIIDASTREKEGGEFIHISGEHLKW